MTSSGRSNLATRVITAAIAAPLILLLLFLSPPWVFFALVLVATAVGAAEFFRMTHPDDSASRWFGVALTLAVSCALYWKSTDAAFLMALLTLLPMASIVLSLVRLGPMPTAALRMAAITLGPLWMGLLTLLALLRRDAGPQGPALVLLALTFAWLADTGGYFVGRFFGRHKLYEAVSPKKTLEGLGGAIAGGVLGALLAHFSYLPSLGLGAGIALGVAAGILGQVGDLGESLLKRSTGVKDSGGILPGHGGMLDRIDALLITGLLVYWFVRWQS